MEEEWEWKFDTIHRMVFHPAEEGVGKGHTKNHQIQNLTHLKCSIGGEDVEKAHDRLGPLSEQGV